MRIGIEISSAVTGRRTGVGHYTAQLTVALQQAAGDELEFVLFSYGYEEHTAHDGARIAESAVYRRNRVPSRLLWMQLGLPRSIMHTRPDICHFPNHLLPALGSRRHPTVVTVHDMAVYRFPWTQPPRNVVVHRALLPLVRRTNTCVVTDSESARQDILDCLHLPRERVHVVHPGVNPLFRPQPVAEDDRILAQHGMTAPYILSVGTLEPRKNQARLIQAFSLLVRQEHLPHHLVLVGPEGWKNAELRQMMTQRDVGGRIHCLGYVPTAHLPALYRSAATLAFPSLYEGFGLPALEAMACGTPVLISTDPALREVTAGAAVIVDPYSVESIAAGLWQLLTSTDLRTRLRTRGLARAQAFTWERAAADTLSLYYEMLGLALARRPAFTTR